VIGGAAGGGGVLLLALAAVGATLLLRWRHAAAAARRGVAKPMGRGAKGKGDGPLKRGHRGAPGVPPLPKNRPPAEAYTPFGGRVSVDNPLVKGKKRERHGSGKTFE
jgi:hypothetical protein